MIIQLHEYKSNRRSMETQKESEITCLITENTVNPRSPKFQKHNVCMCSKYYKILHFYSGGVRGRSQERNTGVVDWRSRHWGCERGVALRRYREREGRILWGDLNVGVNWITPRGGWIGVMLINTQIKNKMIQRSFKARFKAVYPVKGSELLPRDSSK